MKDLIHFPDGSNNQVKENETKVSENKEKTIKNIGTQLQVENLIRILFTIDIDVLEELVNLASEEQRETAHWITLSNTLGFYKSLGGDKQD